MVAPSFQNFEQIGEVYSLSGKSYVQMKNPKTGTVRTCRWYTESEYKKLYGERAVSRSEDLQTQITDPYYKTQKEVLGFNKGYITIFKGGMDEDNDWFKLSICRYARNWGWYVVSTEEIPADLPEEFLPFRLPWESVGLPNGTLKPEQEIVEAVTALTCADSKSQYIGSVGERLELTLTVTKNIRNETAFGFSTMHIMNDENGNIFIWNTAAKSWPVGATKRLRGTVKSHNSYQGERQTWLTRCTEI